MDEKDAINAAIIFKGRLFCVLLDYLIEYDNTTKQWVNVARIPNMTDSINKKRVKLFGIGRYLFIIPDGSTSIVRIGINDRVMDYIDCSQYIDVTQWRFFEKIGDRIILLSKSYDPVIINCEGDINVVYGWKEQICSLCNDAGYKYLRIRNEKACIVHDGIYHNVQTDREDVIVHLSMDNLLPNSVFEPGLKGTNRGITRLGNSLVFVNYSPGVARVYVYNQESSSLKTISIGNSSGIVSVDSFNDYLGIICDSKCMVTSALETEFETTFNKTDSFLIRNQGSPNEGFAIYADYKRIFLHKPSSRDISIVPAPNVLKYYLESITDHSGYN